MGVGTPCVPTMPQYGSTLCGSWHTLCPYHAPVWEYPLWELAHLVTCMFLWLDITNWHHITNSYHRRQLPSLLSVFRAFMIVVLIGITRQRCDGLVYVIFVSVYLHKLVGSSHISAFESRVLYSAVPVSNVEKTSTQNANDKKLNIMS